MSEQEAYWWYITLQAPAGQEEILYSLAEIAGCVGSEECIKKGKSCVQAYFSSSEELMHWVEKLRSLMNDWPDVIIFDTGKIENRPWHTEWMEAFPPLNVGENFVVMAPWHSESYSGSRRPLYIRPGSAFGTGYHESTQGMLILMERHLKKGDKVVDVGCGSGILTVAALKLGAAHVDARDLDPNVLDETKYNACELNELTTDQFSVVQGDLLKGYDGKVDVLTANILYEPLTAMISFVPDVLCDGGRALFSGMVEREAEAFMTLFEPLGLELIDRVQIGDWVALATQVKR